jgi:outer membrane lipoprotein-sorting protein
MYKNKFLFLLFFVSGTLFAQNIPPAALPVINRTVQKYNALNAFSFNFLMNVEENGKKSYSFEGTMLVKKDKYHLTIGDQIIANDNQMMWNYQKNTNEVSIFESEDDDMMMYHPLKILNNWDKEYNLKFIRKEDFKKVKVNILDLTPKKQSQFYKIRLFVDETTSLIQQVMIYETNGTTLTYTITKFIPNPVVADSKFTFDKKQYPNVQVNDMR